MIRRIAPGTLWPKVQASTVHALQCGAIHTIPTSFEVVEQDGVKFLIRIVSNLAGKAQEADQQRSFMPANMHPNPFLPYDQDLFVADISDTHVCLLNKYNVVDHHILMVTRVFQEQESFLTLSDVEALLVCLAEFDGLVFYNAGEIAGASQRHKHLQMVPLPFTADMPHVPIEPLLPAARFERELGVVPGFHFEHVLARMHDQWIAFPGKGASELLQQYLQMLQKVGLAGGGAGENPLSPRPYNLLVTRQWMLLVPRSAECFKDISVNAMGFAGGLLVKNQRQLTVLKTFGPMTALQQVARYQSPC